MLGMTVSTCGMGFEVDTSNLCPAIARFTHRSAFDANLQRHLRRKQRRPLSWPVDILEGAKVIVAVIDASPTQPPLGCNSPELYVLLGERFNSGDPSAAARHNEHQP